MFKRLNSYIDSVTMYRLIFYALSILAIFALLFGFLGVIPFSGSSLSLSLATLFFVCVVSNRFLGRLTKASVNLESDAITALILFFVLTPVIGTLALAKLTVVATLAIASKYLIAWRGKHLFNPAALGAVIAGVIGFGASSWWVSLSPLLYISLVLGLLIVKKIRRFPMVIAFAVSVLSISLVTSAFSGMPPSRFLFLVPAQIFTVWPLIFLGMFMLTEPLTTPPTSGKRLVYGILVGALFGFPTHVGGVYLTPELALVIGNLFSFFVSFKGRIELTFIEKKKLAPSIYEFVFRAKQHLHFKAGQYLEWTFPHERPDARGYRRYFTIASSPTEQEIRVGMKVTESGSSSFKHHLLALTPGTRMIAGQLGGEFVLPKKSSEKLVFIAGGIGVTPFRSMIKEMVDTKQSRDIVLFYTCLDASEFVYKEIFDEAAPLGLKTVYVLTRSDSVPAGSSFKTGFIDKALLSSQVLDFEHCTYYLSGPPSMVRAYKKLVRSLGVPLSRIKTDYFAGY